MVATRAGVSPWGAILVVFVFASASAVARGQVPDDGVEAAVAKIEALGGRVYRTPDDQVDIVVLQGPQVTDATLPMLAALPTLRSLDLDHSQVTDEGLKQLLALGQLEEVSLRRTRVTPAGAAAFKEQHPRVFHVVTSPGLRPVQLIFAALMLFLMVLGLWLFRATSKKRAVLSPQLYVRGLGWGLFLVVAGGVLMLVAIAQGLGWDINLANLFG